MTPVDDIFADGDFARLYDAFNPWGPGDDFYLALARECGGPVLDLGCGTGMLACRIAQEMQPVTGLDAAAAMLQVARSRAGAGKVEWIEGDARRFDLGRRFNLIYLTGHAFQVFLTDEDALAMLRAATSHLTPQGRLAFDTRNPAAGEWRDWTADNTETVEVPGIGRVEESVEAIFDEGTGIASLSHRQRFHDRGREQTGHSRIRFTSADRLAALIEEAGLSLAHCHGWWDRTPFHPASREIIAVARRAPGGA